MRQWSEILSDALSKFDGGKNWIRGRLYNTSRADGIGFVQHVTNADKFCAYGAIYKSMVEHGELDSNPFIGDLGGRRENHPVPIAIERLLGGAKTPGDRVVAHKNDSTLDFGVVKEMFCTGIKRALDEESQLNATDNASTKDSSNETNNQV